ncbi:MAG: tetratricopeptide repeat protein [Rhodoferax sp.]|nr:tetratricopeptide repeat protein [Rhodoferax sp.]MDP2679552.1 tetratricopeptide repeat protein [Rhodoferax sp.]
MPRLLPGVGLLMLCLTVALGGLYGQFLWNPLIFDDIPFFMVGEDGLQPIAAYQFELLQLRSLPYATLAWTQAHLGQDMLPHRVGNLLAHLGTVLALFAFLTSLFAALRGSAADKALPPHVAAFFAALLFALHPVSTYAAGYLVQRTVVMATLFSLLAMWVYVRGTVSDNLVWLWLCVPMYYLAVQSKEHAIMLPAALVALTALLHEDWKRKLRQRWALFLALAVIAGWVLLARKGLLGSVYEPVAAEMLSAADKEKAYPLSVLTQAWLFFKYAFLWLLPRPTWMSIDMREPMAHALSSVYWLALCAYLAWGGAAIWLILKHGAKGLLGFAMFFPWVMFFTEFSSVRIQEIFVLYRSYLWAVGAFCVLPILFKKVDARPAALILSIIAAAMFMVSMERLMVLSHPLFVWEDAEKLVKGRDDAAGAYRIYYNRGTERASLGMLDAAVGDYQRAIVLNPDFAESFGNLGAAYAQLGVWDKAIAALRQAIKITDKSGRTFASAHGNLGTVYFRQGQWDSSVAAFTTALEISRTEGKEPTPRDIHGRAQAYEKSGDMQRAQADYRVSCRLAKRGCDKVVQ